ncbi:MAG TPA: reverse transcriptase domain-containing protein, partial [Ktedonobacteraceae bacterium]|nr:reverse transcriptase domain-containing protein [Ktedonobacteraceae bacterium]
MHGPTYQQIPPPAKPMYKAHMRQLMLKFQQAHARRDDQELIAVWLAILHLPGMAFKKPRPVGKHNRRYVHTPPAETVKRALININTSLTVTIAANRKQHLPVSRIDLSVTIPPSSPTAPSLAVPAQAAPIHITIDDDDDPCEISSQASTVVVPSSPSDGSSPRSSHASPPSTPSPPQSKKRLVTKKLNVAVSFSDMPSDEAEDGRRASRAQQLHRMGFTGKAAQVLCSKANVADCKDEAVLDKLRALHPALPADRVIPTAPAASPLASHRVTIDPTSQSFLRLIKGSNNGAAPGPSGWGGDMLSCLIHDPICMQGIATMLQLIVDNEVPAAIRPYLLASRLIPLTKPGGGIRPIAVGELLYKLAAKLVVSVVSKKTRDLLAPHQLSIATSNGCEKIAHSMQLRLTDTTIPLAGMSVDITNAFNTCDRALLLEKLWATPELAEMFPIVSLAYSSPSKLLIRQGAGPTLWSSNGVRQGCLYQREAYNAAAVAAPSVTLYGYMDNLYIVGPPDQVAAAFSSLKLQFQSLRLECNKGKSFFIYFHDEQHPLSPAVEQYLEDEGVDVKREYAEVLGAVIGASEQAIIDGLMSISPPESMDHFFRRLRNPNLAAQAAMMILSRCGVPKLNYRLRCIPPPCIAAHATAMDDTALATAAAL